MDRGGLVACWDRQGQAGAAASAFALLINDQAAIDRIRQPALETAQRLLGRLPLGQLAPAVGLPRQAPTAADHEQVTAADAAERLVDRTLSTYGVRLVPPYRDPGTAGGVQPQPSQGGSHGLVDDGQQLAVQRVQVDLV